MAADRQTIDPVVADITDLTHDGRGVARINGKAVFVHGALPGEQVQVRFLKRRRRYDEAEAIGVITASKDRIEPRCAHVDFCGGCAFQHMHIDAQRVFKQHQLIENLRRIGQLDIDHEQLDEPLIAEDWQYRRKARLSVRYVHKKQRVLVGFRERRGNFVADCKECHVLRPEVAAQLPRMAELVESLSIKDKIAQFEVACDDNSAALVVRHLEPLNDADLQQLQAFHIETDIAVYLQPKGPDSIHRLAPEQHQLSYAIDDGHIHIDFEPSDFIQVNGNLNQRMVAQAMDWLQLDANDRVLDLFCGLGNFSLPMARRAASVTAVEGADELVQRAKVNAVNNHLSNVEFYVADLSRQPENVSWLNQHYDCVLLDPPRSGAEACLPFIANSSARTVLYVSCQPASLARDLGILVNTHGFKLDRIGIMDMFPHTAHLETMALLSRDL